MELRNRTRNNRWERNKRHQLCKCSIRQIVGRKEPWLRYITARFLRAKETKFTKLSIFFPSLSYHTSLEEFLEVSYHLTNMLYLFSSMLAQVMLILRINVTELYLALEGTVRQGSKCSSIHSFPPPCLARSTGPRAGV